MFKINKKDAFFYLWAAVASWLVFLGSSLLLTEGIMYVMDSNLEAIIYFAIGLIVLSFNLLLFRKVLSRSENGLPPAQYTLQNYHYVTQSISRIFWTIVVLVSLGLMASLSTFFFVSMNYYERNGDISNVVTIFPLLLAAYVLFIIPSFYGIKELGRLKNFIRHFDILKVDLGKKLIKNLEK